MNLGSRAFALTVLMGLATLAIGSTTASARTQFDGINCSSNIDDPMTCMVCNLYFEARGESNEGKLEVARTVYTRMYSGRYEDRVCENVFADNAFSWTEDGKDDRLPKSGHPEYHALRESVSMAHKAMMMGPSGYTNFHATWAKPSWRNSKLCKLRQPKRIGGHIFYDCGGGSEAIQAHDEFRESNDVMAFPQPRPDWYDDQD